MKTESSVRCARLFGVGAALCIPLSHAVVAPNTSVDLELSLVTDVSGSVMLSDYQLMMNGYANAFRSPNLVNAIQSGPQGAIAVNVVFFASAAAEGIPFTYISNPTEADAFASLIDGLSGTKPFEGGTSISSGIDLATSLLNGNSFDGTRVVIDVAGDGTGTSPGAARDNAIANGVTTINGIVVGTDPGGSLQQFYEDEVIAGSNPFVAVAPTFQDFEPEIEAKIEREIRGGDFGESARVVSSTLRAVSVSSARVVTRDVGGRLARLRSGVRPTATETVTPAPYSGKGGMAKQPIVMVERCPWEVWGQVYYSTEDLDPQFAPRIPGVNRVLLRRPDTSIDTFGGTVGIDYDINDNWTIGFAVGAARTDVGMSLVGNIDIDTLSLMPYISYYREISPTMSFYADLLYAYGMTDYDTVRLPLGTTGTTDGDFHGLEFNTGVNFKSGSLMHGPFAQVRYLDGSIDSYTEAGPGAFFFPESDYKSLATQLGYHVAYVMETSNGKLVPRFSAAWEHEFEDDQATVFGFPSATIDEDLAVLGAGIGYYVDCGWNVGLDYEARLGSESQSHYVGLKVGVEF